jgi:hypothetical protein
MIIKINAEDMMSSAYKFMRTLQRFKIAEKSKPGMWPWSIDDLHDKVDSFIRRFIVVLHLKQKWLNYLNRLLSHPLNLIQELLLLKNMNQYPSAYQVDSS